MGNGIFAPLNARSPLPAQTEQGGLDMELNEKKTDLVAMDHPDYVSEITALVRGGLSPKALREALQNYHENDLAETLKQLSPQERERIYQCLEADELSDIFNYIESPVPYLNELSLKKKVDVLSRMDTDAAVDCLKQLDKQEKNTLMELMDQETRSRIALLWPFDEDEIGSVMTTNYIEITADLSVRQAMASLIKQAADHDNISTIYVVDAGHVFYGAIDLKDLIIAREGTPLENLIVTSYPYVYAQELIEDCVARVKDYSEDSIPVLDQDNRLLGVITAQDFMSVVDDELSEDYAKLAGLSDEEDLDEPLICSVKKRLPWLLALLALGVVVSGVVGLFEAVAAQITLVVCFQSLVLDMAGNVGTQSLAVTIRVLMDEQLSRRQRFQLVWKEARVGFINGLLLGSASFLVIGGYLCLLRGQAPVLAFGVSLCIAIALVISMVLSSIAGTVIPIFFKAIHVDPAVASGPLITTVNDLVAVVAYYGSVWLLLLQVLQL